MWPPALLRPASRSIKLTAVGRVSTWSGSTWIVLTGLPSRRHRLLAALVARNRRILIEDWTVFTHLLGPAKPDGSTVWAGHDAQPGQGSVPTTTWAPGDLILDEYQLQLPPDAPPGEYEIEVGLYDPASGRCAGHRNQPGRPGPLDPRHGAGALNWTWSRRGSGRSDTVRGAGEQRVRWITWMSGRRAGEQSQ